MNKMILAIWVLFFLTSCTNGEYDCSECCISTSGSTNQQGMDSIDQLNIASLVVANDSVSKSE